MRAAAEDSPLMTRIESITVAEARAIAAAGNDETRQRLRRDAWNEAWDNGGGETWSAAWDAAFKAGVTPAAAASNALRESVEWTSTELVTDDPAWMSLWATAWPNMADAVAAVAVRHLLSATTYAALTQPMRAAIGPELPGEGGPDHDQPPALP